MPIIADTQEAEGRALGILGQPVICGDTLNKNPEDDYSLSICLYTHR